MVRATRRRFFFIALSSAVVLALLAPGQALAAGRKVHITKSDSAGNAVAGATFELFVDAPPVGNGPPKGAEDVQSAGKCTTDATGQCDIANVPAGDYWVSETGPPAGFTPAPDSQLKVRRRGPAPSVVVVNDKTPKNHRVNSPTGDTALGDGTHIFQFGGSLGVDSTGQNVVVGYSDTTGFVDPPFSISANATSSSGGSSWTDRGEMPVSPSGAVDFGDPSIIWDPMTNRFYYVSSLCMPPNLSPCPIVMRTSTDNGATWSSPSSIFPGMPPAPEFAHSPFITVDPFAASPFSGNVYVGWDMSNGTTARVFVSRSTDGGQTWNTAVPLTAPGRFDYPSIDVAPDGTVHVVFSEFESGGVEQNRFFHSSSSDGGATFLPAVPITEVLPASGHIRTCDGQERSVLKGDIASQDPIGIVVDPTDPNVVFTAFGSHGTGADEADVFVSRSTDGGLTWSPAQPILPTKGDQFFPSVGITPDGRVGVVYFDRRFGAPLIDVNASFFSAESGAVIGSTRITSRSFRIWELNPGFDSFLNDCFGMDPFQIGVNGATFFIPWNDGRNAGPPADNGVDPNIFFAKVKAPRG